MAGTLQWDAELHTSGDSTLSVTYTFAYGDEWDGFDWNEWDAKNPAHPDLDTMDLVGDIVVNVVGPGTFDARLYRWQGGAPNPWRTATLTAANTPQAFPAGSGPNPRTVGDLAGGEAVRIS